MFTIESIRQAIKDAGVDINPDTLPLDGEFRNFGLDSLDMFNIFVEIEKLNGSQISDDIIGELTSIKSIFEYLNK